MTSHLILNRLHTLNSECAVNKETIIELRFKSSSLELDGSFYLSGILISELLNSQHHQLNQLVKIA